MKKHTKYLIFSPINEYGGVNIEVNFIARQISKNNHVEVISLGDYYENAIDDFSLPNVQYNSLNRIIYQKDPLVKFVTDFLCKIKPLAVPNHFRVENFFTRFFPFITRKRKLNTINQKILEADVIIIVSQLTTTFNKEIVEFASSQGKKIFFRITGQIWKNQLDSDSKAWFNKVSIFMHHSESGKNILRNYTQVENHVVIDQTAQNETQLLQIPTQNRKISRFFTLSRLDEVKKVDAVVKAFIALGSSENSLTIYGSGKEEKRLRRLAADHPNINFEGSVLSKQVAGIFARNDCLIISSKFEAGPFTGIESMAGATPLISTYVGAMKERLPFYDFFYNGSEAELALQIKKIKGLSVEEINELSVELRQRYLQMYSEDKIGNLYRLILE